MSTTRYNSFQQPVDARTVDTIPAHPELSPTAPDANADNGSSAYQSYLEIRAQIETFEKLAEANQAIAITLPGYPFFTETRLKAIYIHQSGTVSIAGEAKGGKAVSIREPISALSFALSLISSPAQAGARQPIDVGFVSSLSPP